MEDISLISMLVMFTITLYVYAGYQQWLVLSLTDPDCRDGLPATLAQAESKAAFLVVFCGFLVFWLPLLAGSWVVGVASTWVRATGSRL